MRVAALQIASVGLSPNRLDFYLDVASQKGADIFLLPEYVLNPFFHELISIPKSMIAQQSQTQLKHLKEFAKKYDIAIVAPIVRIVKDRLLKSIVIVKKERTHFYDQQILINYQHWNEEHFFDNEIQELTQPAIIRVDDCKIGILSGFEAHFDPFWQMLLKKDVDAVLVPSISTFDSIQRWDRLLASRAFVNNCYVIRANRIGEYRDDNGHSWRFYGNSVSIDPEGNESIRLSDAEELLIEDIEHVRVKEARKLWGFRNALKKRSAL